MKNRDHTSDGALVLLLFPWRARGTLKVHDQPELFGESLISGVLTAPVPPSAALSFVHCQYKAIPLCEGIL